MSIPFSTTLLRGAIAGTTRRVWSSIDCEQPVTHSADVSTRCSGVPSRASAAASALCTVTTVGPTYAAAVSVWKNTDPSAMCTWRRSGASDALEGRDLGAHLGDAGDVLAVERRMHRNPVDGRAAPGLLLGQVARLARRQHVDDVAAVDEDADVLADERLEAADARREVRGEDEDLDRVPASGSSSSRDLAHESVPASGRKGCGPRGRPRPRRVAWHRWSRPPFV